MGVKKQLSGHGDPLLIAATKAGAKTKPRGHADPLLMEVVSGLEATLATVQEEKALRGTRGVGERTFSKGDALLNEVERYHHAEHDQHEAHELALHLRRNKYTSLTDDLSNALFDPILEEYVLPRKTLAQLQALEMGIAAGEVAPKEELLKRRKETSLFSQYGDAMYDPVLQEYVLPGTTMLELQALKEDLIKKRFLFDEMKSRRDHNLESYELLCDPLVRSYRMKELVCRKMTPKPVDVEATKDKAIPTKYRKLSCGDDLWNAADAYHKPAVATE